jgi:hypothetical protein
MVTGNVISLMVGASGVTVNYVQVPFNCQIRTVRATCQAQALAGDDTITINDGTNDLGEALFPATVTAGLKSTYTPNSDYGNTNLSKGDVLKITTSAFGSSGDQAFVQIELDPYALS